MVRPEGAGYKLPVLAIIIEMYGACGRDSEATRQPPMLMIASSKGRNSMLAGR